MSGEVEEEHFGFLWIESEEVFKEDQMSGRGDRQEFGQSLYGAEYSGGENIQ